MTEKHGMSFAKEDARWREQAGCGEAGSRLKAFYALDRRGHVKRRTHGLEAARPDGNDAEAGAAGS
jgi:hypothetical protein